PLRKGAIAEAAIVPKIGFGHGRLRLDLLLQVRTAAAELAPGPAKPPKPYKEPLTALAEAVQQFAEMDWPLPIDLGVQMAVEPVNLAYRDPQSGRTLALGNCAFHL